MFDPGPDEKVYPVVKLATILDSLVAEGIAPAKALVGSDVTEAMVHSPAARVSLNQIIACYHNADRYWRHPHFAYQAGLRIHVSAYGMYGFAILSSTDFRKTADFAMRYHQLATPLADVSFKEERGLGIWTIAPLPHPRVDARFYRYLVEFQFGIHMSLHHDVMGPAFAAKELQVTYDAPIDRVKYAALFGCPILFGQAENRFIFDAAFLDRKPEFGQQITYSAIVELCDSMMEEFKLHMGLVGKVRRILLANLMKPMSFDDVARRTNSSARTLRRRLAEENTSYRKLVDELRMDVAIKYLRDTDLTVEEIAHMVGFSDAANFRQSFRRWTDAPPSAFREVAHASSA